MDMPDDLSVETVRDRVRDHPIASAAVVVFLLFTMLVVVTAPDTDDPTHYPHGEVGEQLTPWGTEPSVGDRLYPGQGGSGYRIAEYDDGILYGPYWVLDEDQHPILGPMLAPVAGLFSDDGFLNDERLYETGLHPWLKGVDELIEDLRSTEAESGEFVEQGRQYYVHDGEILDSGLEPVDDTNVTGTIQELHEFYLRTYLDPLLYTPTERPTPAAVHSDEHRPEEFEEVQRRAGIFTHDYDRLEEMKVLAQKCGLEYDLVPQEMFNAFDGVKGQTALFFQYPSTISAGDLMDSQREAASAYASYAGTVLELMNASLGSNECFHDGVGTVPIARLTMTDPSYGIDSSVVLDHVRKATRNAERLQSVIERRESILEGEERFAINTSRPTVSNITHPEYDDLMTPDEAIDTFNDRRGEEYLELIQGQNDTDRALTPEEQEEARFAEELPRRYDIHDHCAPEGTTVPVYGFDMDVYPNLVAGRTSLHSNSSEFRNIDHFTVCRCPYREISRLDWYAVDSMYEDLDADRDNATGGSDTATAEQVFLQSPGAGSYDQLGEVYTNAVKRMIGSGTFDEDLTTMWRRGMQARGKLHVLNETYDDFYNEDHMEVWNEYFPTTEQDRPFGAKRFNYFLLTESLYPLTFMTWSDAVWRIDEKPQKYADVTEQDGLSIYAP
jgi:hypothetical protein